MGRGGREKRGGREEEEGRAGQLRRGGRRGLGGRGGGRKKTIGEREGHKGERADRAGIGEKGKRG